MVDSFWITFIGGGQDWRIRCDKPENNQWCRVPSQTLFRAMFDIFHGEDSKFQVKGIGGCQLLQDWCFPWSDSLGKGLNYWSTDEKGEGPLEMVMIKESQMLTTLKCTAKWHRLAGQFIFLFCWLSYVFCQDQTGNCCQIVTVIYTEGKKMMCEDSVVLHRLVHLQGPK